MYSSLLSLFDLMKDRDMGTYSNWKRLWYWLFNVYKLISILICKFCLCVSIHISLCKQVILILWNILCSYLVHYTGCTLSFFLSWVSKTQPHHYTKRMASTRYSCLFVCTSGSQFNSILFTFKSDLGPDPEDARPLPASQCGNLYLDPFSPTTGVRQ